MNGLLKEKVINIKIIKNGMSDAIPFFYTVLLNLVFFVVYPARINTNSQSLFLIYQIVIKA